MEKPGNLLKPCIAVSPCNMACLPNSSCTATFTRQLAMMIQNAIKPALAPRVVVAINSPEPTMEAESMKPGPRNGSRPQNEVGGALIVFSVRSEEHTSELQSPCNL